MNVQRVAAFASLGLAMKGAIKDDFKAQADRKGPYTALKKTEQGGGASQTGKGKSEARVDNPKPFGGGPSFTSSTSRSNNSPRR
jgi:hypothetical protein